MMKNYAVYNPHEKDVEELPYIIGFNNGDCAFGKYGCLVAEDGTALGSYACSNESYMYSDLGILEGTHLDRHERFREHYPDGYRMTFVGEKEVIAGNKLLDKAIERHQKLNEQVEA